MRQLLGEAVLRPGEMVPQHAAAVLPLGEMGSQREEAARQPGEDGCMHAATAAQALHVSVREFVRHESAWLEPVWADGFDSLGDADPSNDC